MKRHQSPNLCQQLIKGARAMISKLKIQSKKGGRQHSEEFDKRKKSDFKLRLGEASENLRVNWTGKGSDENMSQLQMSK